MTDWAEILYMKSLSSNHLDRGIVTSSVPKLKGGLLVTGMVAAGDSATSISAIRCHRDGRRRRLLHFHLGIRMSQVGLFTAFFVPGIAGYVC